MAENGGILDAKYWQHVERPVDAALGVRRVEWVRMASNKDAPEGWGEVVVYRPLDTTAHVYQKGMWDFRPVGEFLARYTPITDRALTAELDALAAEIYNLETWPLKRTER